MVSTGAVELDDRPSVVLMDYELPDRTYILEGFTDEFTGLEVKCDRNATVALYLQLSAALEEDRIADAFQLFGDEILMGWNLTKGGAAVEATGTALQAQPIDLAILIVRTWLTGRTAVSVPLKQPSTNGASSNGATAPPMDLGSMSTPN